MWMKMAIPDRAKFDEEILQWRRDEEKRRHINRLRK